MSNLIEQVRVYSAANGGHAANATASGVTLAHFIDVMDGRQIISSQVASTMAPLIGATATALMRESTDLQFCLRRNAVP
jgi:hypothetical protein